MKPFKLTTITLLMLLIFAFSAMAQRSVGGKVIEVIDGKTAVVKMPNGSYLTVLLQYIEVPERDQPLYLTVNEHLQKLILDQPVIVFPRGIKGSMTIGKMTLNDIDISQQMIRDGAAWYAVPEKSGQDLNESATYQRQEALAKAERRGIWADVNMIPAWEFRAARQEARIQAEKDALEKIKREAVEARALAEISESPRSTRARQLAGRDSDQIIWANPKIDLTDIPDKNGLIKTTIQTFGKEVTMTATAIYDFSNGKDKRRFESRTMYLGNVPNGKEMVCFAFVTKANAKNFKNSNNLTIYADGKKFNLGKAFRVEQKEGGELVEMLFYYFEMDTFTSIATAEKIKFSLAEYSAEMSPKSHDLHKSLFLQVAKK